MQIRTTAAIGAALLLATLTACSSQTGSTLPKVNRFSPPDTSPSPSSSSSSDPKKPKPIGATWTWDSPDKSQELTATATSYTQPTPGLDKPDSSVGAAPGSVWAQVEGKFCNTKGTGPFQATQFAWTLEYADGTSEKVTGLNGGNFPRPEYPTDGSVSPGKCVAGKIQFPVPGDKRPARIVYSPEQPGAIPAAWTVPAH